MAEDGRVEVIVKYHGAAEAAVVALGGEMEVLGQGYGIVTLAPEQLAALYALPQMEHIELPRMLFFEQSTGLEESCAVAVQAAMSWDLRGAGVLVAVIDSGLDYRHQDFRLPDGSTRLLWIWDQSASVGRPPDGFLSGAEYGRAEINEALRTENPLTRVPYTDALGHGTAVTGIAAGAGRLRGGCPYGMAPEADIISVKLGTRGYASFARTTELMRAVKYVIDRAREAGEAVAINMSVGMNDGSHRGDSLFETYLDAISSTWKCVLVAPTGNEGAAGHHYQGQVQPFEMSEIVFFTAGGIPGFFVSLWKDFADTVSVELILPDGRSSGVVNPDNQVRSLQVDNMRLRLLYGQPSHYSLAQQVYIEVEATQGSIPPGLWRLRLQSGEVTGGEINLWLPSLEAVSGATFFDEASTETTLTIPSTAGKLITVAGYQPSGESVLDFSGRGPTATGLQKPDVAAPAAGILSTLVGGGYDTFTGTSFAAPFVTGAAALLMQWGIVQGHDPFLYGERLKAFLRLGAKRTAGRRYPNATWGYGILCVARSLEYAKRYQLGGGGRLWETL